MDGDPKALSTLYDVLVTFSKTIAPTLPFTAEQIYMSLRGAKDPESVHLCDYPKSNKGTVAKNKLLLEKMQVIRDLASLVHNLRSEVKQPLRQKMASIVVKGSKGIKSDKEFVELLKDEVNVLVVKFDISMDKGFVKSKVRDIAVGLDTKLTPELEKEGLLRELLRELQDARKEHGLVVGQKAKLTYDTQDLVLSALIEENQKEVASAGHFLKVERGTVKGNPVMGGRLQVKITV